MDEPSDRTAVKKGWATRVNHDRADSATRAALLTAARGVFEEKGFARTTVAGITGRAGVGRATFYVYFSDKEEVFAVLARQVRDRLVAGQELGGVDADDAHAVAEATTTAYLDAYLENLAFIAVIQHQSLADPAMSALWQEIHARPLERSARYIRRLVRRGEADPAASPEAVARAAGGMVSSVAGHLSVAPDQRERATEELVAMYVRLLGLPPRDR
ncbi:TetR/AcrR family transcriptional regulator [Nocardiopsis sp. HNM0947]|uniref:TetR/AcrR family transcriptional regulator n=1 Tax=Nocardiopsis coralli TaxID=2772213 RepID=A0ABR9P514_9ACTN|nr:TetR/AcrR family transcriptional regulator [Nocardiopsis coralli]MBE2998941.1 TetR/AcrR family transcriptional regulator [Nocardiopsis coralli]